MDKRIVTGRTKTKTKQRVNLYLDIDMVSWARQKKINLSETLNKTLRIAQEAGK